MLKHCTCKVPLKHRRSHYWVEYMPGLLPHPLKDRLYCYRGPHEDKGYILHKFLPSARKPHDQGYLLSDKNLIFSSTWFKPLVLDFESAREDDREE